MNRQRQTIGLLCERVWLTSPVAAVCVAALLCCSGCDSGDSATPVVGTDSASATATQWVLSEMPSGDVVSPTDVMDLNGDETSSVLAGKIDAGELDPFQAGEVAFMISQLPDEGHAADDPEHADNCPFCKHKLENAPKAIVQFVDADGGVAKGDARQLLGLQKGDVVYITGTSQYNPAVNTVMVRATGVFRKASS